MSTPWDDLLIHTVNLWRYKAPQDVDAGAAADYSTAIAASVPAYVETEGVTRDFDDTSRVLLINELTIFLTQHYGLVLNDRIDWTDASSVAHQFFVTGSVDMTPQGGLVEVAATERI